MRHVLTIGMVRMPLYYQMNVRVDKELKMRLMQEENYSEFIRQAAWEKLEKEKSKEFNEKQIEIYKEKIKECQVKIEQSKENPKKTRECLTKWHQKYVDGKRFKLTYSENYQWVKSSVLPELKKIGYKGTEKDVLDLIIEWPEG